MATTTFDIKVPERGDVVDKYAIHFCLYYRWHGSFKCSSSIFIRSCIKVDLGFVSPDNVEECIRLTDEFRLLLNAHRSKEDKLEVVGIAAPATFRWEQRAPDPLPSTQNDAR
ncbi:hypothetical protein Tco_0732540 [Tanacetum coccineum]